MSQDGELFAGREDAASQPSFDQAIRGYDKRQVDRYVARMDSEVAALAADRDRAFGQARGMAAQLHQMQAELNELSQRQAYVDRASFRHLGPMVDQILALAEKQAEAIINAAEQHHSDRQAEGEKLVGEARERAAQTVRELEADLAARREEHDKAHDERRAAAEAELADIREAAEQARTEGEAARERAEQEARRISELGAQQAEQARTEWQRELEAARVQAQQELAQLRAMAEREINDKKTASDQKSAALHAEAQQHAAEVRRRADEQAASHQQQLVTVQQQIQVGQQALAQLQTELNAVQQKLAQTRQEGATAERDYNQLTARLGKVRQDLTGELTRLEEARHAADSAELHAREVRARVQREAKRVADLAAAAVMAAAAGGADTGEYRQVPPVRRAEPGGHAAPAEATGDAAGGEAAAEEKAEPHATNGANGTGGHPRHDADHVVPAQRGPQPAKVAAEAE